jgi:hypothetical protein
MFFLKFVSNLAYFSFRILSSLHYEIVLNTQLFKAFFEVCCGLANNYAIK